MTQLRCLPPCQTGFDAGFHRLTKWILLLPGMVLLAALPSTACGEPVLLPERIDYNFDIKPILSDRCYTCHGPDAGQRQAQLRLDTRDGATSPRAGEGAAIVPGAPADSPLLARIQAPDPDVRMPPPEAKLPPLSDREVALLEQWIAEDALFDAHWSLLPIGRPDPPVTGDPAWPANPIDHFVLARLEQYDLEPSLPARRETLLRRLTFDLTGLPPTPAELDTFLADTSPQAYEHAVDRLLKSSRYGERMAVDWLDLARYSDTYGFQVDRARPMWPWRDWVIRAYNKNLPLDDFYTYQLAGDLLPNPTDDQILATAFNRLHPQKVEGGSVEEEFRVEYVADRTQTFGTAFLGLTLQCARCHDHKYDPVSQAEFYQLFAFFNNIDEAGLYSYFTNSVPSPSLLLLEQQQKAKLAELAAREMAAQQELTRTASGQHEQFLTWLDHRDVEQLVPGQVGQFPFDEIVDGKLSNLANPDQPATTSAENRIVAGRHGSAIQLTGDDVVQTPVGNFSRNTPFSVSVWVNAPEAVSRAVILHRSRAWTDAASRGYELLIKDGQLAFSLIHFWPGNAISVQTRDPLPIQAWQHITVTYDGSSRASGLDIFLNGRKADTRIARDNLVKNITGGGGDHIAVGERFRDRGFKNGRVDELQVFDRQLTPLEVAHLFDGQSLQLLLERPLDQLSTPEKTLLYEYYVCTLNPDYQQQLAALKEVRDERSKVVDGSSEIMVMRERSERRPTYVLTRGAYDAPTTEVRPDTPAAMPRFPSDQRKNRLGLARWLTDPSHPLTARVTVNRVWQRFFGEGLVRTPDDFGSQGEMPTHPQLLDWLAGDLIDHGWDLKRLVKTIVMSATYQQTSDTSADLDRLDPGNRLLARGPRYRLPAEMIRDNALFASGLLVDKVGGPPVRPYEVAVSFKPSKRDTGEGLYRRSVYTFWQRTGPAPVMMVLDASKRDVCVVKREKTATPLQALVLLNDPQLVEAARVLGQRLLLDHPESVPEFVNAVFVASTSRQPTSHEQDILIRLFQEQQEHFEQHIQNAEQLLQTGDAPHDNSLPLPRLAAAAVVAQAMLNHDECVRKR